MAFDASRDYQVAQDTAGITYFVQDGTWYFTSSLAVPSIEVSGYKFLPNQASPIGSLLAAAADPSLSAAANVTALQAALNIGGLIQVDKPGTFLINDTLVIGSNTKLVLGPKTIFRMAPGAQKKMLVNSAINQTAINITSITSVTTVATVTLATAPTTPLAVNQWVSIHGSQTSGYNGCYLVASVVSPTVFTYNTEIVPAATPAVVSTRYTNMTFRFADTNIVIMGGTWYYDFANNGGATGQANSCGMILGHLQDYLLEDINFYDVGTRCIYPYNARAGVIRKIRSDLTRVCVQTNGAIHGLSVSDIDTSGTDDGVAIMAREDSAFPNFLLSEGDVINVRVERIIAEHSLAHAFALYNFDQLHLMDDVKVDGISGNCAFGVYIAGASGKLSSFGNIEIRNIKCSTTDRGFWIRFCSIKRLRVFNFAPDMAVAGVNAFVIDTQATIDLLEIDGFTWVPATTTDAAAAAVSFITGGVAVKNFKLRNFVQNSSWVPSGAAACVSFATMPEIWEIADSYLNAGANAVLGFLNAAGQVGTFRNCRVATARLVNGVVGATMNLLNIKDCRVSGSTNSCSIASPMTVNFEGYEADGGTNWAQVNGAIAVSLKAQGLSIGALPLALAGGPTLQVFSYEVKVDVGLLALTAGQFANHSSAVGGRNAANQQGLAVSVLGTNWYALATGASGVNTVIV